MSNCGTSKGQKNRGSQRGWGKGTSYKGIEISLLELPSSCSPSSLGHGSCLFKFPFLSWSWARKHRVALCAPNPCSTPFSPCRACARGLGPSDFTVPIVSGRSCSWACLVGCKYSRHECVCELCWPHQHSHSLGLRM